MSELPKKDISNVVIQCRQYSAVSYMNRCLCLNYVKEYLRRGGPVFAGADVCLKIHKMIFRTWCSNV